MQAYIVRRLLALIPTLFFASLIVFVTVRLIPGDIIDMMLSQNDIAADKFSRDQLVSALGLDKPMWKQYVHWMGGILLQRRFRAFAVAEHAGCRTAAGAPARHLSAGFHGAGRGADRRHPDRRLFGHAPGHGRRLSSAAPFPS